VEKLSQILYVEDAPDLQITAKLALKVMCGFAIEVSDFDYAVVRKAAEFAPQLIFLDIKMPGMGRPPSLKQLSVLSQTVSTPVKFVTTEVQPKEDEYYKSLDAVDVIAKPCDPCSDRKKLGALS